MMLKMSKTVGGRLSTLEGKVGLVSQKIGLGLLPIMESVVSVMLDMTSAISDNLPMIKDLAIVAGIAGAAWGVYTVATNAATIAQWALNVAMDANIIGIIILAVAALVAGFILLWHKVEKFRATMTGLFAMFEPLGQILKVTLIDPLIELWDNFQPTMIKLKGLFMDLLPTIIKVGKVLLTAVFTPLMTVLDGVVWALDKIKKSGIGGVFGKAFDKGYKSVTDEGVIASGNAGAMALAAKYKKKSTTIEGVPTPTPPSPLDLKTTNSTAGKVQGSKQTNISINLGSLVEGGINVTTNNLREGVAEIKDNMVEALLQVLNESDRMARV
jgi:hypothetical protein